MDERSLDSIPQRVQIFRDIAEALNHATDITSAMDAILPRLGESLGLETAWAFRFDERKRSFVEVGASGLPPALDERDQAALKSGWCECQEQFVEGRLGEAVNIVRCSRLKSAQGDTGNLHFHASIPLRSKEKPLGILNVAAPGLQVFTADALVFLQAIGQQVAVAVDRARLFQQERDKATRLQQLAEIAATWVSQPSPEMVLQRGLESFAETFHYAACGVIRENAPGGPEIVAVAEATASSLSAENSYIYAQDTNERMQANCESILLAEAKSAISTPLPQTEFQLRLESPAPAAFGESDGELLQAFAWQIAAAYIGAVANQQAMRHAHLEERHRIAADLHDSVSQRLFSAQLLLRTATAKLEAERSAALNTAERVSQLLAESQQEMRDLVRALRRIDPTSSFLGELQSRIAPLTAELSPKVTMRVVNTPFHEPSHTVRLATLAIVDEALHNALKHAEASTINLSIGNFDGTGLHIRVEDDGKGCPSSAIGAGLGTRTMFERALAIRARLAIVERPEGGTKVTLEVPDACIEEDLH